MLRPNVVPGTQVGEAVDDLFFARPTSAIGRRKPPVCFRPKLATTRGFWNIATATLTSHKAQSQTDECPQWVVSGRHLGLRNAARNRI